MKTIPQRGEQLEFTVNGKTRLIRGEAGDGAVIMINGKMPISIQRLSRMIL